MWSLVLLIILNSLLVMLLAVVCFRLYRARSYLRRLSRISHEMRTPLGIMLGVADNLAIPGLQTPADLASYSRSLGNQVRRLRTALEGMMLGAGRLSATGVKGRPGSGSPVLYLVPAEGAGEVLRDNSLQSLAACLQPLLDFYGDQFIAQAKHREFIHTGLEACPVLVPRQDERLVSILDNLLQNALRYGLPAVRPLLRPWQVRCRFRLSQADRLEIVVEDEGPGLRRKRLSGRMVRQDEAIGSRKPAAAPYASGIGSLVISEYTRDLGGRLSVESPYRLAGGSRQHGSRFTVSLPLAPLPRYTDSQP